ncbi:MAG: DUF1631 domain-containing protein [Chromatiales bacterium]|jgi:hypothetical protein
MDPVTVPNPDSRKLKYQTQFQPLLNRCKDMVLVYINALLAELFANSDKALTHFAQKAETNEVQNRFFEAMSSIRQRHGLVEHEFREILSEGFDNFWRDKSKSGQRQEETELELIDLDAMNENTALENIVTKTVARHSAQLYALGQRLSVISGGKGIKAPQIPAGPYHLAYTFNEAINCLDLESRIKVIVLALFDKYVLKQLGGLYEDFNNNLKEAGVLPHLRPTIQKSEQAASGDTANEGERTEGEEKPEQTQEELGQEMFDSILDLMSNNRRRTPDRARAGLGSPGSSGGGGQTVSTANLVSTINNIQPSKRSDYLPDANGSAAVIPNVEIDEAFLSRVKQTLTEERHKLYSQIGGGRLEAADEDTIDLVGMLFEYMLNDPVLPPVAKALISHLHTPYLKVAITDRSLLTDSDHPARLLLDSLVEAGSHWIDERNLKRGIYPDMQNVVDRVLKEFSDNLDLFNNLLKLFRKKMEEYRRRSDILEKRAQDTVKGKEKLNIARQRASQEMRARSFSDHLPQAAKEFLEQTWVDKLIFILLRHPDGEVSDEWKDALKIADDIAWAFEPKETDSEQGELAQSLPALRQSIEAGLASLGGFHQEKSKALFELLTSPQKAQAAAVASQATATPPKPSAPRSEPEQVTKPEEIPQSELAMMEKLRNIQFGTWFEVTSPSGKEMQRVKLSWLSPLTSSCMFVDRAGVQTAIKPLRTLAQEIIAGKSKILEESNDPFVERTLHAIRRMLQRSMNATDETIGKLSADEPAKGREAS